MNEIKEPKQKINNVNTITISFKLLDAQKVVEISLFIKEQISVQELKEFLSNDFDFPVEDIILFNPLEGILDNLYQFSFKENNKIDLELIIQNNDNSIKFSQSDKKSDSKKLIRGIPNKVNDNFKINSKNINLNFKINRNNSEIQKNNKDYNLINKIKKTSYSEVGKSQRNINFKTQQIKSYNQEAPKINFFTNNNQNKMILPKINETIVNNDFNEEVNQKLASKKPNANNFLGQKRKIMPSFVTTITNRNKNIHLINND